LLTAVSVTDAGPVPDVALGESQLRLSTTDQLHVDPVSMVTTAEPPCLEKLTVEGDTL
jgi:hypothetical protein